MKLFVIDDNYKQQDPFIAEIEVLKETSLMYFLKGQERAAGYASRVLKKHCSLSLTPGEAWEKYIAIKKSTVAGMEEKLNKEKSLLSAAVALADWS